MEIVSSVLFTPSERTRTNETKRLTGNCIVEQDFQRRRANLHHCQMQCKKQLQIVRTSKELKEYRL